MNKSRILIITIIAVLLVGCGNISTSNQKKITEDILESISNGNAKTSSAINIISYGTADTYEGLYNDCCRGLDLINEAKTEYESAIEKCGEDSKYSTLKKRLQSVVDSIPPKPASSSENDLDRFTSDYSSFVNSIANLESETEAFTEETGFIINHALK